MTVPLSTAATGWSGGLVGWPLLEEWLEGLKGKSPMLNHRVFRPYSKGERGVIYTFE